MYVCFFDMCSGGSQKEKWSTIYIEAASEEEAKIIFYNRFGHNPNRVTCTCCGEDYSIDSDESLEKLVKFHGDDLNSDNVLFIPASEIKPEERIGDLPEQGYVWMG